MRTAIETLRAEACKLYRESDCWSEVGLIDSAPCREHASNAAQHDRDADLLEALSNPPETVEELRERLQKVTGLDDEHTSITAGEFPGNITVAWSEDCEFHEVQISAPTVRAAWFAIVGMMEVGR